MSTYNDQFWKGQEAMRAEARETPHGRLMIRAGLEPWDAESGARLVALRAAGEIAELERENVRMKAALKTIASYDQHSYFGPGICTYGCDSPQIAQAALILCNG